MRATNMEQTMNYTANRRASSFSSLLGRRHFVSRILFTLIVLMMSATAHGQASDGYYQSFYMPTNNVGLPPGRTEPGSGTAPAAGAGIETPGSSNFMFSVPVVTLKGRGQDLNLNLIYNSRVWSKHSTVADGCHRRLTYNIDNGWPAPGFRIGFGKILFFTQFDLFGFPSVDRSQFTLISPDGTRHHMEWQAPFNPGGNNNYVATDGSFVRFSGGPFGGTAVFDDGTQVVYGATNPNDPFATWNGDAAVSHASFPTKITERNGNFISITYANTVDQDFPNSGPMISSIQDTLGRFTRFYYNSAGRLVTITVPSADGLTERQVVRFYYSVMNVKQPTNSMFWWEQAAVLTHVYFPGNQIGWRFDYTPHGIAFRISKFHGMSVSSSSTTDTGTVTGEGQNAATTEYNYPTTTTNLADVPTFTRRTDDWAGRTTGMNGTSDPPFWTFSNNETAGLSIVTAPDGTVTETQAIAYAECGARSPFGLFSDEGLIKEVRVKKNGIIIRHTKTEWEHDGNFRNWRKKSDELIDDAGNSRKTTFTYTSFNNISVVREFGFDGAEIRRTETTYETGTGWINRNLIRLVSSVKIFAGGSVVPTTRSDTVFDANTLSSYSNLTMHDATVGTFRGNVTSTTSYSDAANGTGAITESGSYDVVGNRVSRVDKNGHNWITEFSSTYKHAFPTKTITPVPDPQGLKGSAAGLETDFEYNLWTGQVTRITDQNDLQTSYEYDDLLDRITKVNRPDGGWTTYEYNDLSAFRWMRTRTTQNATQTQEAYEYFDGKGQSVRTFAADSTIPSTPWLAADQYYDAFGRVEKTSNPYRTDVHSGTLPQCSACTTSIYDALGRVTQVTHPDGAASRTEYVGTRVLITDAAGKQKIHEVDAFSQIVRVWEIAPQDSQTTPVSFPDHPEVAAGYVTNYAYDVLGNLRKVEQGDQRRYFAYDSVSRLIRARYPEQTTNPALSLPANLLSPISDNNNSWSSAYTYIANGELSSRTDARGVVTNYTYDGLNRNTTVSYSDDTPAVHRFYDTAIKGKGLAQRVETAGTFVHIFDEYDTLARPLTSRQRFWVNGNWGDNYTSTATYDKVGNVLTQSYPSGRSVTHTFDTTGRLTSFTGNLGGAQKTYATGITYSPFGGLAREQYGTTTALYSKSLYNIRGQMFDRRVSSVDDQWDWNRGRLIWYYSSNQVWGGSGIDNNGNLVKAENWIPRANQVGDTGQYLFADTYTYDALNRLSSVDESSLDILNNGNWLHRFAQAYSYDRYGNRRINSGGTNGGVNNAQHWIDPNNNRLYAPADQNVSDPEQRLIRYDAAGNQKADFYSAGWNGTRTFDAEQRLKSAVDSSNQTTTFVYDGEGRRIKRILNGTATWQVYGMDGELLAEYASQGSPSTPLKEYGYRNGQLLISASPATAGWGAPPTINDNPLNPPGQPKTEIKALHITQLRTAINALRSHFNLPDYQWQKPTASGGAINNTVFISWTPIDEMRTALDQALGAPANGYAAGLAQGQPIMAVHIQELRDRVLAAWQSEGSGADIRWLVSDFLGTPRMILDQSGTLSGVTRRDYLPFGEEIKTDTAGRTTALGFTISNVRQQFTGQERDDEIALDYFSARYYSSTQGRFTSVDQMIGSANPAQPQSWNRFSYTQNNPLRYVDPSGLWLTEPDYYWLTNGAGYYRILTQAQWNAFLENDEELRNWYPVPPGTVIPAEHNQVIWGNMSPEMREEFSRFLGYTVRITQKGTLEFVSDMLYEGFPAEMSRYVEAHTTAMEIEFFIMSFFTGPIAGGGALTSLGLKGGTKVATTAVSSGAGVAGEMAVVRTIQKGEKVADLINEGKSLTFATGNEHALVKLASGERALVSGNQFGINFGTKVNRIYGHTHPFQFPASGVSAVDRAALRELGQRSSWLFEHGDMIKFGPY